MQHNYSFKKKHDSVEYVSHEGSHQNALLENKYMEAHQQKAVKVLPVWFKNKKWFAKKKTCFPSTSENTTGNGWVKKIIIKNTVHFLCSFFLGVFIVFWKFFSVKIINILICATTWEAGWI